MGSFFVRSFLEFPNKCNFIFNFRQKAETGKGRGSESVRKSSRDTKVAPTPEFNAQGDLSLKVP